VEAAYESLQQKTTDVYIQRARQLYSVAPQRTCLLLWTLDDVSVVAMADPSHHGYENVVRLMQEIDSSRFVSVHLVLHCFAPIVFLCINLVNIAYSVGNFWNENDLIVRAAHVFKLFVKMFFDDFVWF